MTKRVSRIILSALSYLIAITLVVAVPVLFIGNQMWADMLSQLDFMKIHPRYSGGEVIQTSSEKGIIWNVHRPVFDGLFRERKIGFVQLEVLADPRPDSWVVGVDFDQDAVVDFDVHLKGKDDASPEIVKYNEQVQDLTQWAKTETGWIVRVGLFNQEN